MSLDRLKEISIRDDLFPGEFKGKAAKCPFPDHQDKTPSFQYFPRDNGFKCYGCGRSGDAISFWMHLHNYDFRRAIEDLSERFRIPLEQWTPEQEARVLAVRKKEDALSWAVDYFERQMKEGSPEWKYLVDRGFAPGTIRELRLGHANKTLLAAVQRHPQMLDEVGLTLKDLEEASVIAKNEETGRYYDYFRDRITFPIIKRGRVVGISGGSLPDPNGNRPEPKYLNLKGVPLDNLFLEDNIRNEADLCEGLPDTMTLYQLGFPACGQQGTSGLENRADKFKKCHKAFLWFDGDAAGQKAIVRVGRAIWTAQESGEVRVVSLPAGVKDINEYYLDGATQDDFRMLRSKAKNLIDWLIDRIPADMEPGDLERELRDIMSLLVHRGPLVRDQWLAIIRQRFKLRMSDLRKMLLQEEGTPAAAGEGEAAANAVLKFSANRERIPAMDFAFNSPAMGNLCAFLPVMRKFPTEDGRLVERQHWEAVLVTATHSESGMKIEAVPCDDLPLTDTELSRIPFESTARGRWRIEGKYPHSVEKFIKGEAPMVNGWNLFNRVAESFKTYIWLRNQADYDLLTTWTMLTYCFHLFDAIGYLHLTGTRESGKSNIANILDALSFNAQKGSNQSTAVIFRSAQANCGTQIIEEAERLQNPKPGTPEAELMTMCNDGYKRGACAYRIEEANGKNGKKKRDPVAFNVYAPRVFVSINDLNTVLASRCIIINCVRATAMDLDQANIKDLTQSMHWERKRLAETRDQLHCWALQAFPKVLEAYQSLIEDETLLHLRGREREMWLPLIAIALFIDNERAMLEAAGDQAQAEDLLTQWDERGDTVMHRLIDLQKIKEADRRVSESDQSVEVAVLKATYNVIADEQLAPYETDLARGALYCLSDLSELVKDEIVDAGAWPKDWSFTGRRLVAILFKTGASEKADRVDRTGPGPDGKRRTRRCLAINLERIKSTIGRLGGKVGDDAA